MRLASATYLGYKRLTDLRLEGIPLTAKLIVLAGPNGSGKSSIFDGLRTWHGWVSQVGYGWDETYGTKMGSPSMSWKLHVSTQLHGGNPAVGSDAARKALYVRTAHRNEADFTVSSFGRLSSPLNSPRVSPTHR